MTMEGFNYKILKFAAGLMLLISTVTSSDIDGKLKVGFYDKTCPHAEEIVRETVNKFVSTNPGLAAGLIRMHFHDCFVRGCDGSLLLDSVPGQPPAEKDNAANSPSLRGFEVIDEAKARVEEACPKTVSCADILAFAARDSALKAGYIGYAVPSGRRDGRVSLSSDVLLPGNIPPPSFSAAQLRDNFKGKGLSLDEMVTLSGSHSVGVSHCSAFSGRLSGFNATFDQDPSLNPGFAASLRATCKADPVNNFVANDFQTPTVLDNKYYGNLISHKGVLASDQTLFDSSLTTKLVVKNAKNGRVWAYKFAAAMIKMGKIDVLTGQEGEIRYKCRFVN